MPDPCCHRIRGSRDMSEVSGCCGDAGAEVGAAWEGRDHPRKEGCKGDQGAWRGDVRDKEIESYRWCA